jgi:choline dehydrogenase
MPLLPVDPAAEPNFLMCPTLCKPQSRGHVDLRSKDPNDPMVLLPHYLQCASDVETLIAGIELALDLGRTPPLKHFCLDTSPFGFGNPGEPRQRMPVPHRGAAALKEFVQANATTVWHPGGTCRMGRDRLAVVDPQLRVYGVDGLRVADASVMPAIPSGNINAACIMIGERAADLIRRRRGPPQLENTYVS